MDNSLRLVFFLCKIAFFCLIKGVDQKILHKNGMKESIAKCVKCKARVHGWHMRLQEDCEYIEDDKRPGHPSTSTNAENVEKANEIVMNGHPMTIREGADDGSKSIGSCHDIFFFFNILGITH